MRHEKTDLKVFVVVTHVRPSFFWYDTNFSEIHSADIIDHILEKSVSCQKMDGRGHAHPSFFWHDNDKDLKVCFLVTRVRWFIEYNVQLMEYVCPACIQG